jgi:hypothetical protein
LNKKLEGRINLRVEWNKNFTRTRKTATVIDRLSVPESLGLTNTAMSVEEFELLPHQAELQAREPELLAAALSTPFALPSSSSTVRGQIISG